MNEKAQTHRKQSTWKSVTVRLKEDDLAVLNGKLKLNSFKTFSDFVHAWIKGEYPPHEIMSKLRD